MSESVNPFDQCESSEPSVHLISRYFTLTTGANVILLGSLLLASGSGLASMASPALKQAAVVLAVALGASVINWLAVEPVATKLMFQRWVRRGNRYVHAHNCCDSGSGQSMMLSFCCH